jgi:hypothetical protein
MSGSDEMKPGVEVVPLRTALGKFARLLDEFSSNLRVWRDAIGGGYERRWRELLGDQSASLLRTLDEFLLEVFQRQLIFLRALRDLYVREVYEVAEADPFAVPEQANRFRSKADLKLLYLEDQIQQLRIKLGLATASVEEDLFDLPATAAAPPVEVPIPQPVVELKPEPEVEQAVSRPAAEVVEFGRTEAAAPASIPLEELQSRVDGLRRAHRSKSDLQIKTQSGVETISLQYFAVSNGADGAIAVLDLERFVANQRLALSGALKMTEKLYRQGDDSRRKAILKRIQDFILSLYQNARMVLEPRGGKLLPYTGRRINRDVLLNFEAKLRMSEWSSANDIEDFRGLFNARLEWPLTELLDDQDERRKYLESIVFAPED